MLQLVPFQASSSVVVVPPESTSEPTAMQLVSDEHEIADRTV
jgi:hypothetical protein